VAGGSKRARTTQGCSTHSVVQKIQRAKSPALAPITGKTNQAIAELPSLIHIAHSAHFLLNVIQAHGGSRRSELIFILLFYI